MKPKFSIILNLYDPTRWQRQMTYACLISIRRFTDEPYELIIVDHDYDITSPGVIIAVDNFISSNNLIQKTWRYAKPGLRTSMVSTERKHV